MISIRKNTFETNSSSCHAIAFPKSWEDIDKFRNGELVLLFETYDESLSKFFKNYPKKLDIPDYDNSAYNDIQDVAARAVLIPPRKAYEIAFNILKEGLEKESNSGYYNHRLKDLFSYDEEASLDKLTFEQFMKFHRDCGILTIETWEDFLGTDGWECPISIKFTRKGKPYINCSYHD